jgi:hypothetical protein
MKRLPLFLFIANSLLNFAQTIPFDFEIKVIPKAIPNLPGVHSYAYAQSNGKWLIIGGRRDGLHARQPFNAFPEANNNTDIIVIDPQSTQIWSSSINQLPASIAEQLQSTNMNFHQVEDTLYIIGGYAYSQTAQDHITFPNLTTLIVSDLINAVISGNSISSYFKQITNQNFAVTGGHLGKIGDTFYLVGGHRFDGRYNPMGNATYTQSYVNGIRKFEIDNSGSQLSISNYSSITDQVHLHRRDYNLVPQIFPNGDEGYMISSGVFQVNADLPFLYPVEITSTGYNPITTFNQYLSNYHSPKVGIFDALNNTMHSLFFGGMSQYYYSNGNLVEDVSVPFVKTISRVSRDSNGNLQEVVFPNEMPALLGASAEFIANKDIQHSENGVLFISSNSPDSLLIGHILGGIKSTELNPFTVNNTNVTTAYNGLFEVWLKKNALNEVQLIDGSNPFNISIFPNPAQKQMEIESFVPYDGRLNVLITNIDGQLVQSIRFDLTQNEKLTINTDELNLKEGTYFFNFVFDNKYSRTEKIILFN